MLGALRKRLAEGANKMNGRKDLLEAVAAACALIAAADGEIEDSEVDATISGIAQNPILAGAFPAREIEAEVQRMLDRAQAGRAGRMGLYREIEDIAENAEDAELVLLVAMDVSDADGENEPEEQEVIKRIAQKLKLDPAKYDV